MSRPVCAIAPGLSTPQGDASFPEFSQHIYQSDKQNVDYSSDSQQHAITQRSHSTRGPSPVAEHGNPGATAMSTNVQSSTVAMAFFNHGMVTPGQSPSFIDGQIVSDHIPPAPWDTGFALDSADISTTVYSQPQHVIFAVEGGHQLMQLAPAPPPSLQLQSFLQLQPTRQLQLAPRPLQTQPARGLSPNPEPNHQVQRRREPGDITSPFHDCIGSFGRKQLQTFSRPSDGRVNGYVKFSWPREEDRRSSTTVEVASIDYIGDIASAVTATRTSSQGFKRSLQRRCFASPASTSTLLAGNDSPYRAASILPPSQIGAHPRFPTASLRSYCQNDTTKVPQLPSQFGHYVAMDIMGRKLFSFYIHNWCPGRSVLKQTNLWLTEFASMQHPAVVAAIQSLAGIYVHDYLSCVTVQGLVNKRFAIAEARFRELLQAGNLDESESVELVTLASLLSMRDVVLTECRLRKPHCPRWLMGFSEAEKVLQRTDPGSRFYEESSVQVSALRLSQSVIVGKAVVLAQLMMPLPPLATFNPVAEESRFGYLLSGTEEGMCEIHGGCGFSKRLLHIFSQVAYCATLMLQDGETPIIPRTADMLRNQLLDLKQWSGEYDIWADAKTRPHPIERIRRASKDHVVENAKEMTEVTAEAWKLAGIAYMLCRLFRIPRNHQMVIENLADLAKCISIMPTSGFLFTAQAPLLPVFFLGLLATVEEHVRVADAWFQEVIETPVRSSVPPLYESLKRIQSWMGKEVPVPTPNTKLPCAIAERQAWWERMVHQVQEREREVLCLT